MYKKLIAMFLALSMVLGSCGAAFADAGADVQDEDDVVMADEAAGAIPDATNDAVPNLTYITLMEAIEAAEAAAQKAAEEKAAAEEAARLAEEEAAHLAAEEEAARLAAEEKAKQEALLTEVQKVKKQIAAAKKEREEKYVEGLAHYMRRINTKMGKKWSLNLAQCFIDTADKYNLDERVLMAMAQRESRFNSKAKSVYGYKGMMQTSDWLAKHYGYEVKEVFTYEVSLDIAARYLKALKNSFKTYTKALSGYVYGGSRVKAGKYSTKHAKKILETRDTITEFLEKRNYIETEKEEKARKKAEEAALERAKLIDAGIDPDAPAAEEAPEAEAPAAETPAVETPEVTVPETPEAEVPKTDVPAEETPSEETPSEGTPAEGESAESTVPEDTAAPEETPETADSES